VPAKNIIAELFGKKTGICRGQGGSMHMFSKEWGLVRPYSSFLLVQLELLEMLLGRKGAVSINCEFCCEARYLTAIPSVCMKEVIQSKCLC
jgi:hypothetical protein